MLCLFCFQTSIAQNSLEQELSIGAIKIIEIDGNQIFSISVSTTKTDHISITSKLDGEYQSQFQIVTNQQNDTLKIGLKRLPFTLKVDDKRNAHKVIAATLYLEIPEYLMLNVFSDVGSVDLKGIFNNLSVELLQGHCNVMAKVDTATINTIDGDISIITNSADISAYSNHGDIIFDEFSILNSKWKLQSVNGNIRVAKPE